MSDVAAIDIGGTKVLACLVDPSGTLGKRVELPTEQPEETALEALMRLMEPDERPVAVGAAVAGYVESASGLVVFAPNLRLKGPDFRSRLISELALPVVIENDASAAAWGEFRFGAGRGADPMILLTVGTGIGGGAVIGGELYRGALGFAGEFGHMTVSEQGRLCACGSLGCLEAMASGSAIEAYAAEGGLRERGAASGEQVAQAALDGDPDAIDVLVTAGGYLGMGIANLINAFDPQTVVVGGGVAEGPEIYIDAAREAVEERLKGRRPVPKIVAAALGNDAGVAGVADLARTALEAG